MTAREYFSACLFQGKNFLMIAGAFSIARGLAIWAGCEIVNYSPVVYLSYGLSHIFVGAWMRIRFPEE